PSPSAGLTSVEIVVAGRARESTPLWTGKMPMASASEASSPRVHRSPVPRKTTSSDRALQWRSGTMSATGVARSDEKDHARDSASSRGKYLLRALARKKCRETQGKSGGQCPQYDPERALLHRSSAGQREPSKKHVAPTRTIYSSANKNSCLSPRVRRRFAAPSR